MGAPRRPLEGGGGPPMGGGGPPHGGRGGRGPPDGGRGGGGAVVRPLAVGEVPLDT